MISTQEILKAADRIRPLALVTPVDYSPTLSALTGAYVWLKLEHTQPTGSFKVRGAANKLLSLSAEERIRGIVTASNGNHGMAVCYVAQRLGLSPQVFMRHGTPSLRVERIRAYGGEPVFFGDDPLAAELQARAVAQQTGKVFISPYNDEQVIAGQGTLAVELHEQLKQIDAVFIAVGGGGLLAGVATYLKAVRPHTRIIGCWPEHSPVLYESLKRGRIVDCPELPTISDSTAGGLEPETVTFALCRDLVDEALLVSEDEIKQAMRLLADHERWMVEGAAGVALAGLRKAATRYTNGHLVAVLCGRNIGWESWQQCLLANPDTSTSHF